METDEVIAAADAGIDASMGARTARQRTSRQRSSTQMSTGSDSSASAASVATADNEQTPLLADERDGNPDDGADAPEMADEFSELPWYQRPSVCGAV
jgi:hypothetical protein